MSTKPSQSGLCCPACQYENRSGVKFCESCGSKLELPCPACGDPGPPERKFCGNCGQTLDDASKSNAETADDSNYTGTAPTRAPGDKAERRHLTVLFCDMVGSTDLAQHLDPEELSDVIRNFNDTAHRTLTEFGGYVARYMGDGLLVYFGYPQSYEDNAERSVRAGIAVTEAVSLLDNGLGEKLNARVGIATGRVVTGETARTDAGAETLALGNTPNLAARLQSYAEPGTVVVADATKRTIRGNFRWTDLGVQELKGFRESQRIWQVAAENSVQDSSALDEQKLLSGLLDREDEIEFLDRRWRRAKEGILEVVNVVGEAGVGKSRLVSEFREILREQTALFLPLTCFELGRETALYPVRRFFERAVKYSNDNTSDAFEKFSSYIRSQTTPNGDALICLARAIGMEVPSTSTVEELSPRRQQRMAFQLLTDILVEQCRQSPMLLLIEDLHWIDLTSIEWLTELIQSKLLNNVLILITSRPGYHDLNAIAPGARTITLNRMPAKVCESLILNVTGGRLLPKEVVEAIIAKADGVPLFVEEITKSVLESELLSYVGGQYKVEGSFQQIGIPDSLQDILMSRLDRVPLVRDVAQTASVIGREFSVELLSRVIKRLADEVVSALEEFEKTGLVRRHRPASDAFWEFKHALVRDAAYESILKSHRLPLHGLIAEQLQQPSNTSRMPRPELLAYHLGQSGNPEAALEMWRQAARNARASWANQEAVGHLNYALTELAKFRQSKETDKLELEIQLELGDAMRSARGSSADSTLRAYERAVALCGDGSEVDMDLVLKAYHGAFIASFSGARLEVSKSPANNLLLIGERQEDRIGMVAGHQSAGMQAFATGNLELARTHLEKALELGAQMTTAAIDIQFPELCQGYLSWALHLLGEPAAALMVSDQSIESARKTTPYSLALALGNACYLHQFRDDCGRIEQLAGELVRLSVERDLPSWQAVGKFFISWCNCKNHPGDDSVQQLKTSLELWQEDEIETPYFKTISGKSIFEADYHDDGIRLLREAQALMRSTGEIWYEPQLEEILSKICTK